MKLNLMCATKHPEGYTNVDLYCPDANIHEDVRDLDYRRESVDEVRWHHGIEHLNYSDAHLMLWRIRNWLKIGGTCYLGMPNVDWTMKMYADGKIGLFLWTSQLYGVQKLGRGYEHLSGWTPDLIYRHLIKSGWKKDEIKIDQVGKGNLEVNLTKLRK